MSEHSAAIRELVALNLADPVHYFRRFHRDWFPSPIPWFHRGIIAIMTRRCGFLHKYGELDKIVRHFVHVDELGGESPIFSIGEDGKLSMRIGQYTAIMMPRGFSKTTLFNATNIWKILHMMTRFTLYTSESSTHADMQLGNIKNELENNELIFKAYGEIPSKHRWTQNDIETSTGIRVVSRGRGGQIRGLISKGHRPDNIGADDIEDEESVLTDMQREKTRRWVHRALLPAIDKKNPNATVTVLGTLLHRDAMLLSLARDPRFTFIRFSAVDRDGDALWPEHMPLEAIDREKAAFAEAGDLAGFYMEYMSELSNEESAKFKNFKYGEPSDLVAVALAVDPAISNKPGADFFAAAVVGMGSRGQIYVLDVWGGRGVTPREQVDKIFELREIWQGITRLPVRVGVESIAYQQALVHLLREEMFRRSQRRRDSYFEVIEIRHGNVAKDKRILGVLQPRYAAGYVTHRRPFGELEVQLRDYPNGKKDFPDAVAMAVTLLDPYSAAAIGDESLEDDYYQESAAPSGAP